MAYPGYKVESALIGPSCVAEVRIGVLGTLLQHKGTTQTYRAYDIEGMHLCALCTMFSLSLSLSLSLFLPSPSPYPLLSPALIDPSDMQYIRPYYYVIHA